MFDWWKPTAVIVSDIESNAVSFKLLFFVVIPDTPLQDLEFCDVIFVAVHNHKLLGLKSKIKIR